MIIAALDATENKEAAKKFDIKGFPTIKYFPKGSTDAQEYDGGRSADTIAAWVNDKIGTKKMVRGAKKIWRKKRKDSVVCATMAAASSLSSAVLISHCLLL